MIDPREALHEWRTREGLSLRAAGRLLGASYTWISNVEQGHRLPNRRLANALLRYAGIPQQAWDELEDTGREGEIRDRLVDFSGPDV